MKEESNLKEELSSADKTLKKLTGVNRLSPLRKYLFSIGKNPDPKDIPRDELNKIAKSSRYKQWKILARLQRLAKEIKNREEKLKEEELQELHRQPKLDVGDPDSRRHVHHKSHNQKLKFIQKQAISAMDRGEGDIIRDPTAITSKNPKAKHGFLAMGKGKMLVRKNIGHRPQKTFRFSEETNIPKEEPTEVKKDNTSTELSDKTKRLLDKSREINLKTGTIEINPTISVSRSVYDKKD